MDQAETCYRGKTARYWFTLLRRFVRHVRKLEGDGLVEPFYMNGISQEERDDIMTIVLEEDKGGKPDAS